MGNASNGVNWSHSRMQGHGSERDVPSLELGCLQSRRSWTLLSLPANTVLRLMLSGTLICGTRALDTDQRLLPHYSPPGSLPTWMCRTRSKLNDQRKVNSEQGAGSPRLWSVVSPEQLPEPQLGHPSAASPVLRLLGRLWANYTYVHIDIYIYAPVRRGPSLTARQRRWRKLHRDSRDLECTRGATNPAQLRRDPSAESELGTALAPRSSGPPCPKPRPQTR